MHQVHGGFDARHTKFRPALVRVARLARISARSFLKPFRFGATTLLIAALAACGGGGGDSGTSNASSGGSGSPPPPAKYTIGGSVSGLTGTGLVLQNNGGDNLAVSASGAFTFATSVNAGSAYAVAVSTQPSGQNCTVSSGSGTANANVTNVSVSCTAVAPSTVTIGGSVTGLTGTGLVLLNNGGDSLTVSAAGSFTFHTAINTGAAYAVTVSTQPTGPAQYCRVAAGAGTASADVTSVAINCLTTGQFLYTADHSGGKIIGYSINPTTGLLTSTGPDLSDGTHPAAVSLAPNGKFAFSASDNGLKIHAFTINPTTGTLTELTNSPFDNTFFTVGHQFPDIAVDAQSKHLYLASQGDNLVAGFSIDATTGSLTPMSQAFPAGSGAGAIPAFSPDGKSLYVMNQDPSANGAVGDSVSGYSINPTTGELTALTNSPWVTGGSNPTWIAFRPDGKFAYVANTSNYNGADGIGSISVFSVDSTGALMAVGTPVTTERIPSDITLDSTGTHLYVPNRGSHSISVFSIDPQLGTLTPVGVANAGLGPILLVIEPTGRFAYAASSYGNDVWGYTINSDGSLAPMAAPYVTGAPGSDPLFINVDPSGQFAYTSNSVSGGIVGWTINQNDGSLTALSGNPYPAAGAPYVVSMSPELPGIRD